MDAASELEFASWHEAGIHVVRCWSREIHLLLKEKVPFVFEMLPPRSIVELLSGNFLISPENDLENIQTFTFNEGSFPAMELARAIKASGNSSEIILLIPENEILRISMRVPLVRSSLMKSALGYELERLSPIPPESLYADFVRGEVDPMTGTAEYTARAVRRTTIEQSVRLCKNAGLNISVFRFKGDARPPDMRCFSPGHSTLISSLWRRYNFFILLGILLLVGCATLVATYVRQSDVLAELDDRIVTEAQIATKTDLLERRIAITNSEISSIAHAKDKAPFLSVLANVTRIMPDGSWVTRFQSDGQRMHLQGYSTNASALVPLLDRSGQFQNAQFGAAIVQDASTHADRFDLTADMSVLGR